jgi:flagellar hook-associated protein 1 FlgK
VSKIHGMMDVGKRSMMNSQTALQTTGHNIANKSTEGYSRQRVELQTAEPTGLGNQRVGTGSKTAAVTRTNNPYLEKQIGKEQSNLGYYNGKGDAMNRVEQVFNEQANKGLNAYVTDFFNSYRELSNNPESLATRTQVKETAHALTQDFKRVNTQLTEIRKDIDQQVGTHIDEVNQMTGEIAQLNSKIEMVQNQGGPANDERDRRDLLIKKLGEKINIRWAEGSNGDVTITAGNSAVLVAGDDAKHLSVRATPATDTKGEGNVDIFYQSAKDGQITNVTSQMSGGAIGGLLEVRDKNIGGLLENADKMAYSIANDVNAIHSRGFDAYNRTGHDFFEVPLDMKGYSASMNLTEHVSRDPLKIAAAGGMNSPGDNRVANAIGQLQYENTMPNEKSTLDEFYNSMVGEVGIQSRKIQSSQESQKGIVDQLKNIRESVSGVSLDEETTKLIEYQKAFDASARLIKTADEMFDTVLNLKRL